MEERKKSERREKKKKPLDAPWRRERKQQPFSEMLNANVAKQTVSTSRQRRNEKERGKKENAESKVSA